MFIIIVTTFPEKDNARKLSKQLLEARLVACAQIGGSILSIYNWQDKIQQSKEYLLTLKTRKSHYKKVENLILKHHPYDNPEILAIDVQQGSKRYLDWIQHLT
tara:strand:+ start:226 stop:534 length:309 start_codon:yes stop_codon:yes gene_type:complete